MIDITVVTSGSSSYRSKPSSGSDRRSSMNARSFFEGNMPVKTPTMYETSPLRIAA